MRSFLIAPMLCLTSAILVGRAEANDAVSQSVGEPLARFKLLKPGVNRYLRYKVMGPKRTAVDIWMRAVTFELKDGTSLMHIVMRWDEVAGATEYLEQDSWFEPGTFRPLTHVRTRKRREADKLEIGGYRFLPDRIVGMPELPENLRKDFSIDSSEAAYNFEYDMEFLRTLPLASAYSVSIPFYDPGDAQTPTARYTFKVAGSDRIRGPDGREMECWLVTADYNTGKVQSRFWFDKKTQILIREEQPQDDGSILVKTLLEPEAGDVVSTAGPTAARE
jgi:hypothetical protein